MNAVSFALVLVAILLGAAAQVLLKAGTNAVGHFEFALENALPVGWQLVTEPRILGGTACYALSLVVWIMALSRADLSEARVEGTIGLDRAFMLLTRIEGLDLSGATGLDQSQVDMACGDAKTKLPKGLATPAGWPCAKD